MVTLTLSKLYDVHGSIPLSLSVRTYPCVPKGFESLDSLRFFLPLPSPFSSLLPQDVLPLVGKSRTPVPPPSSVPVVHCPSFDYTVLLPKHTSIHPTSEVLSFRTPSGPTPQTSTGTPSRLGSFTFISLVNKPPLSDSF